MGLRYWLLFAGGILLFGLVPYANYAYPHGPIYPTGEIVERYEGRQSGELWEEDESRLNNPAWVMWIRHNEFLVLVGGFALVCLALVKGEKANRNAKDKAKQLLLADLVAHRKGATEHISPFVYHLEAKRLSSNMWTLYRYFMYSDTTYAWLVDIKYKTVSAKTKAAELLSDEKLKEILE